MSSVHYVDAARDSLTAGRPIGWRTSVDGSVTPPASHPADSRRPAGRAHHSRDRTCIQAGWGTSPNGTARRPTVGRVDDRWAGGPDEDEAAAAGAVVVPAGAVAADQAAGPGPRHRPLRRPPRTRSRRWTPRSSRSPAAPTAPPAGVTCGWTTSPTWATATRRPGRWRTASPAPWATRCPATCSSSAATRCTRWPRPGPTSVASRSPTTTCSAGVGWCSAFPATTTGTTCCSRSPSCSPGGAAPRCPTPASAARTGPRRCREGPGGSGGWTSGSGACSTRRSGRTSSASATRWPPWRDRSGWSSARRSRTGRRARRPSPPPSRSSSPPTRSSVLHISGDKHHFAVWQDDGVAALERERIYLTAGGGGAYLSLTDDVPATVPLQPTGPADARPATPPGRRAAARRRACPGATSTPSRGGWKAASLLPALGPRGWQLDQLGLLPVLGAAYTALGGLLGAAAVERAGAGRSAVEWATQGSWPGSCWRLLGAAAGNGWCRLGGLAVLGATVGLALEKGKRVQAAPGGPRHRPRAGPRRGGRRRGGHRHGAGGDGERRPGRGVRARRRS